MQLAAETVSILFSKMQVRYGHKWTSQHSNSEIQLLALTEWAEGLAGLTNEEIKTGLDRWDGDWPPSLPEFRKACLPQDEDGWLEYGKRIGCDPKVGEGWPQYIDRIKLAKKNTQMLRLQ